jgi:polyribonucleotide nucleotidyltransferase
LFVAAVCILRAVKLETGRIAALANGAVLLRHNDTAVLTTVVADRNAIDETGFLPLTVDYREKVNNAVASSQS